VALRAAFERDDGTPNEPGVDAPWDDWIAASKTRNFCGNDPIVDWLDRYGERHGFVRDERRSGFDPRTDFRAFVFRKGCEFERAVMEHLTERFQVVTVCRERGDVHDRRCVEATFGALADGVDIVAQAALWNAETSTYGMPDLLVRSDVLRQLFPDCLSEADASHPTRDLPIGDRHYRVVDIKFKTLDLLRDGHAASGLLQYTAQVWLYNEALGRLQGFTPEAGFLLGRRWKTSQDRGRSAFERVARIDRYSGAGTAAVEACRWLRRVRCEGAAWQVLPEPSVPELRPNMRERDETWHAAKLEIAAALDDLTLLPRVTPEKRALALATGLARWTDAKCCATALGVTGLAHSSITDAVIKANQSPEDGAIVFPGRVAANEHMWRDATGPEFFVDFETVNDLDDEFDRFPEAGGQALIFMIGCGHFTGAPDALSWNFRVFTVSALVPDDERRVIEDWLAHMTAICEAAGGSLAGARVFHWSPAETSTLTEAYNAAHQRHGEPPWPQVPWIDLLNRVIKAEPVTVRGAFGFGLKAIARAMHARDLIETRWQDSATDGLGAMVGAWSCHHEARRLGVAMPEIDLMREIEAYNEVDCKVMAEVLAYLRRHR
jgi:hypothetical protein